MEGLFTSVDDVKRVTDRITLGLLGNHTFTLRVDTDGHRVFVQVQYDSPCTKTGEHMPWKGRKWFLSEYMTENEVIFTVYTAYKMAIEHEMMESFKVDNVILINPHVDYRELLRISGNEVKREQV